jgi:isopentenyldiphosphate isomerase
VTSYLVPGTDRYGEICPQCGAPKWVDEPCPGPHQGGWKDEFDRRCRRLLGITDDTQRVSIDTEYHYWSTMTGTETWVELRVGTERMRFDSMGEVIRALDEVVLDGQR